MNNRNGFTYIGIILLLGIVVAGSAVYLTQINRSQELQQRTIPLSETRDRESGSLVLKIVWSGGLCPSQDGGGMLCTSEFILKNDGSYVFGDRTGKISGEEVQGLSSLINNADFESVKSKRFLGVCPRAYDGSSPTYTFYLEARAETIDSCAIAIDVSSPLFSRIDRILEVLDPGTSTNSNSLTDWQTYRNEQYGFEFKFPPSWQWGGSNRGGLYLDGQQEGHIEVLRRGDDLNFGDRPANLAPAEREKYRMNLDQFMEAAKHNDAFQYMSKTQLNGYNAYEIDFRTMVSEDIGKPYHEEIAFAVFVENEKGYVYQIMFDGRPNKEVLTDKEKQILSTFKFIK